MTSSLRRYLMLAQALNRRRAVLRRERWPAGRIAGYQRQRLEDIVAHASRHSRFYRERYGGPIDAADVQLESLPAITKQQWMAGFADVVTDDRLRLDALRDHLDTLDGDETYLGQYRVMASSGTTGAPGVYVWSRADWLALLVIAMRVSDRLGYGPRWPRLRVANIVAPVPRHMSYRISVSLDVGVTRRHRLDASRPIGELVEAVGRIKPDILTAYPSIAAALAGAQLAGDLDIAPSAISVSGEVCTPDMRARIIAAWGVAPFNVYAMTEAGVVAMSCEHGTLHAHDDAVIMEPVDEQLRPVPPGVPGDKLLVTSLLNRTQPVIRMQVSDQFAWATTTCPCGRGLRGIEQFHGRADDVLTLPAADGSGDVTLHAVHLRSLLGNLRGVDGYQVTLRGRALEIDLLGDGTGLVDLVERRVGETLRERGVGDIDIHVARVDALAREQSGKLKLVRTVS